MSGATDRSPGPSRRRLLAIAAIGALLLVALGVIIGLRMPWGAKKPRIAEGVAMRANNENDLVLFEGEDHRRLTFGASRMWWEAADRGGQGDPPCLRTPFEKA